MQSPDDLSGRNNGESTLPSSDHLRPLRARTSASTNPTLLTSFVGRGAEIAQVKRLLSASRLVTLTGAGGCGKTRLALQTMDQVEGTFWCDLAPLSDPTHVPFAVARALGLEEQSGQSALDAVIESIGQGPAVIVLDNCEHVLEACAAVASAIISGCPQARILATSLQPLGLPAERAWPVPPLASSGPNDSLEATSQCDAVRLFVSRASEALPDFALDGQNAPAVAAICRRLDGLPLAIELAAARVRVLTVEQIAERLDNVFALLSRGQFDTVPRHQTLQATMDWTYRFLSEREQTLLRRVSVFAGPFTLEMVEQVCEDDGRQVVEDQAVGSFLYREDALDLLTGLAEKSFIHLLAPDGRREARYRLLEVIRQYSREKLEESGQAAAVRDRYLHWCTRWAEQAEPHLTRTGLGVWLKQFESHEEHFRASLRWACTSRRVESGLRLANTLFRFWFSGAMLEGQAWLEELLQLDTAMRQSGLAYSTEATRAWALFSSGRLAIRVGELAIAAQRGQESLALFRGTGERLGLISALNLLALVSQDTNDYSHAMVLYDEALALSRQMDNPRMTTVLLTNQGLMYYEQQDFRHAAPLFEEANAIGERTGSAVSFDNLGCLATMQGDLPRAETLLEKELEIANQAGDKHAMALALMDLGEVARRRGDIDRAQTLLVDALERHRQMGNPIRIGENLIYLAHVARHRGRLQEAGDLYTQSLPHLEKTNYTRLLSQAKTYLGILETMQGRDEYAIPFFRESLRIAEKGKHALCRVESLEALAGVWMRQRRPKEAARLMAAVAAERERLGAPVAPVERPRYDEISQALTAALGESALETIRMEGRALDLQNLVAEAVGLPREEPAPGLTPALEPELKIYALGPTRVLANGRALTGADWKYAKAKELLFYLLSNPPATKGQIGLELWPDASPEQLRSGFHRAMHHLRRALGHSEWVPFAEETYTFDRNINYWCDLHEFEAGVREAQALLKSGFPPPALRARATQLLEEATGLWRGDFLQDLDVAEWAIFRREQLRESFLQTLLDLGQLYLAEARYADAISTFQRGLSFDEYVEVAHRELMRSYARQGNVGRAVRHYEELRRLMRDDLGAEPSAETRLLYERLKRGDDV